MTRIYLRSGQSKRSPARPGPPPRPTGTPPTGSRSPPSSPAPTRTPSAPAPPPSRPAPTGSTRCAGTPPPASTTWGSATTPPAPFPSETPAAEPTNGATGPARPLLAGAAGSSAFMRELVQHAEGDAFSQAMSAGNYEGQSGTLYVTQPLCGFCVSSISASARSMGLSNLTISTPDGVFGTYTPATGLVRGP